MSENYRDKTFVITGAVGGIGRETVDLLHRQGARLHLIDVDRERLEPFAAIERVSMAVSTLDGPKACEAALAGLDRPIYGFIHLAGIFEPEDLDEAPRQVWDRVLSANLHNAFDLAVALHRRFDANEVGRIVMMSSLAFRRGAFDHVSYSAAKGGLVGLVRALSRRFAPNILVNGLAPGLIDTPMPQRMLDRRGRDTVLSTIPLGRLGHPRECASVIDFLCGPGATYITGQIINVDGGVVNS
ncbi:MAG: SDR family oxidoreductase [Pseudomonadota bacterium]